MLHTRMALFWGGATLAGAFSGLLAFVISFMAGTAGLEGWAWIFVRRSYLPLPLLPSSRPVCDLSTHVDEGW